MTLKDTGMELGITGSQVRDIQSKAMRTLRVPSRCNKLRAYYEEYLAAAPVHHVGIESFRRTWTSEVEREVLGRI